METSEALDIYRDKDAIEKMFRHERVGWTLVTLEYRAGEPPESNVFLTFIAGIIRNEIFQNTKTLRLEEWNG